jgi:hypothetical protein
VELETATYGWDGCVGEIPGVRVARSQEGRHGTGVA